MKLPIPEGLEVNAEPGASTELLAKFKVTEDGQLILQSLDGVPVAEEEEEEPEAEEEEMSEEELGSLMSTIGAGEGLPEPPPSDEYIASKR